MVSEEAKPSAVKQQGYDQIVRDLQPDYLATSTNSIQPTVVRMEINKKLYKHL
jgi:hypothetical protein